MRRAGVNGQGEGDDEVIVGGLAPGTERPPAAWRGDDREAGQLRSKLAAQREVGRYVQPALGQQAAKGGDEIDLRRTPGRTCITVLGTQCRREGDQGLVAAGARSPGSCRYAATPQVTGGF